MCLSLFTRVATTLKVAQNVKPHVPGSSWACKRQVPAALQLCSEQCLHHSQPSQSICWARGLQIPCKLGGFKLPTLPCAQNMDSAINGWNLLCHSYLELWGLSSHSLPGWEMRQSILKRIYCAIAVFWNCGNSEHPFLTPSLSVMVDI